MLAIERCLMSKQRRTFPPEFKQQAACSVLDQGYSHVEASRPIGVGESLMRRWVQQLQLERQGVTPQGKAITPDQQRIQELEARIECLEREKSILKLATALMMSQGIERTR
jgi:transposase